MNYLPANIEDELTKKYRPASIKAISNGVKRVIKGVMGITGRAPAPYNKQYLLDYDKVRGFVETLPKDSVKRALIHNVWVVLQREAGVEAGLLKKYEQLHKQYSGDYKKSYTWQEGKPEKYISLETISRKMEETGRTAVKYDDILQYVVLALYVYMPAFRGEDWYKMKKKRSGSDLGPGQGSDPGSDNIVDLDAGEIVLAKYKTSETHGERRLRLPKELKEVLQIWFGVNKTEHLLAREDGGPLVGNEFTLLMNRALGVKIGTSDLRKIYIAEILNFLNNHSSLSAREVLEWRKQLAHAMGHTVEMQEFVYSGYRDAEGIIKSSPDFMKAVFQRMKFTLQ